MKAVTFSIFIFMQLSFLFGSSLLYQQHKCWLWDSACLTASAQAFLPTFTAGIPELGIEPLDTMYVDGLQIDQDGYTTYWKDIYLQGLKNAVIDNLSIDLKLKHVKLLFYSDLSLKCNYISDGKLISMPISGKGPASISFHNTQIEMTMPFEIIKDAYGKDIMDLRSFHYWHDIKNGVLMHFENLYYGNNEQSKRMHIALHENWKNLTITYGRYLFDKSNEKIFKAIRSYMHSQPLEAIALY